MQYREAIFLVRLSYLLGCLLAGACAGVDVEDAARLGPGDALAGEHLFAMACATCHGFAAEGFPGLGKALRGNRSIREQTEDQLVQFLNEGRAAEDLRNSTGVEMPPRGGDPALSDQDLRDIAAFLRSINE